MASISISHVCWNSISMQRHACGNIHCDECLLRMPQLVQPFSCHVCMPLLHLYARTLFTLSISKEMMVYTDTLAIATQMRVTHCFGAQDTLWNTEGYAAERYSTTSVRHKPPAKAPLGYCAAALLQQPIKALSLRVAPGMAAHATQQPTFAALPFQCKSRRQTKQLSQAANTQSPRHYIASALLSLRCAARSLSSSARLCRGGRGDSSPP